MKVRATVMLLQTTGRDQFVNPLAKLDALRVRVIRLNVEYEPTFGGQ